MYQGYASINGEVHRTDGGSAGERERERGACSEEAAAESGVLVGQPAPDKVKWTKR